MNPESTSYILPAARAVIFNAVGEVLLIRRSDNLQWGLPAGGMEPGESVTECMKREVREETGLVVKSSRAFAIYSEPRFTAPNRPEAQLLTVAFKVDEWEGELLTSTNETKDAQWFSIEELLGLEDRVLPDFMPMYKETVADCLTIGDEGFVVK